MSIPFVILQQVFIMFLLTAAGYLMFRFHKISQEGSKSIANILLYLSLPCVIINGFQVERTPAQLCGLLLSSALALGILVLSILVSRLLCGKNPIESFAGAFSNPGFFGIPLIAASLSEGAVFYIAAFIAFLNLFQWTYGVSLLTREYRDSAGVSTTIISGANSAVSGKSATPLLLRLLKAPFMIAIIIGLFFFLTGMTMPVPLKQCVSALANLNTPLAMFTIGIYLAQTNLLQMFRKPRLYLVSLVRMIIIPLLAIALLCPVPNNWYDLKIALLIAAACPVGSNIAVYAQLHGNDYSYAVETVVISTLCAIITLPFVIQIAELLW